MSKLARMNPPTRIPRGGGPIRTTSTTPDALTAKGGAGFSSDVKSELFTLAVTNFVGEETFHESAVQRDARFVTLIDQATKEDPAWTANLLYWLRTEGNMRSASIVGAVEYGVATGHPDFDWDLLGTGYEPRKVLDSVLQRADEPGEAAGYWIATRNTRTMPAWLRRALGDAAKRLYTPFNTLKWDGQGQAMRFGDVVSLSTAKTERDQFKWQMDRRYGRAEGTYGIRMLEMRQRMEEVPVEKRREIVIAAATVRDSAAAQMIREAGYTWESISGWIQGPMDAAAWEAIIPTMGYMALLRNLRNFDQAKISTKAVATVTAKLTDPEQVAKSRQLPFRFWSAYKNQPGTQWLHAISTALDLSLRNVPQLTGRTLLLLDGSGSMGRTFTVRNGRVSTSSMWGGDQDPNGTLMWEQAGLFALALATKQNGNADFFIFDDRPRAYALRPGGQTLREMERLGPEIRGGATQTALAIRTTFDRARHDRVVVFTDEQADRDGMGVFNSVPDDVPCYTFNIAGYRVSHAQKGTKTRHGISGLTDSAFQMMQIIEARARGSWPWEVE